MPRRWKEVVPDRSGVLWTHWLRCTLQIWCVHTGSEPSTVDITSHRDGPTTATSRLCTVDYIEMIDDSVVFDAGTFAGSWEGRKKERKEEERGKGIHATCLKTITCLLQPYS